MKDEKEKYSKICPNCGSRSISFESYGFSWTHGDFCKDCGYGRDLQGVFPEVRQSELDSISRKIKKGKKII